MRLPGSLASTWWACLQGEGEEPGQGAGEGPGQGEGEATAGEAANVWIAVGPGPGFFIQTQAMPTTNPNPCTLRFPPALFAPPSPSVVLCTLSMLRRRKPSSRPMYCCAISSWICRRTPVARIQPSTPSCTRRACAAVGFAASPCFGTSSSWPCATRSAWRKVSNGRGQSKQTRPIPALVGAHFQGRSSQPRPVFCPFLPFCLLVWPLPFLFFLVFCPCFPLFLLVFALALSSLSASPAIGRAESARRASTFGTRRRRPARSGQSPAAGTGWCRLPPPRRRCHRRQHCQRRCCPRAPPQTAPSHSRPRRQERSSPGPGADDKPSELRMSPGRGRALQLLSMPCARSRPQPAPLPHPAHRPGPRTRPVPSASPAARPNPCPRPR